MFVILEEIGGAASAIYGPFKSLERVKNVLEKKKFSVSGKIEVSRYYSYYGGINNGGTYYKKDYSLLSSRQTIKARVYRLEK